MGKKRIIPCLDIKDGRVVKGISFEGLADIGDPLELAEYCDAEGADELVVLDISATVEGRATSADIFRQIASRIRIPLTVGGGIASIADIERMLALGAAKVSMGSAIFERPEFLGEAAESFGSKRLVAAIDASRNEETNSWEVCIRGGKVKTGRDVIEWAKEVERLGAGEILLTSMDADGHKTGYDLGLTGAVAEAVKIPIIASGGAGKKEDFLAVFTKTKASGALAASLFHRREIAIGELKSYLLKEGMG